jgi:hypothetical protein
MNTMIGAPHISYSQHVTWRQRSAITFIHLASKIMLGGLDSQMSTDCFKPRRKRATSRLFSRGKQDGKPLACTYMFMCASVTYKQANQRAWTSRGDMQAVDLHLQGYNACTKQLGKERHDDSSHGRMFQISKLTTYWGQLDIIFGISRWDNKRACVRTATCKS